MLSPLSVFVVLFSVFATSVLSGVLGMAGGMVLMGVLAWFLPVEAAMVLHATTQFFANGSRAFFHRRHIFTKTMPHYAAGLLLVFAVFSIVLYVPNRAVVFTLLGIAPFVALAIPKDRKLDFTKPLHAFTCGLSVMGFQLTGGVSGPLLDLYFQHTHLTRHQTVATKAATQAISHTARFIYFGFIAATLSDTATTLPWWIFFAVIPVAIAGTHASKFILEKMTDKQFYKLTQKALILIGGFYLCKAATLWLGL